MTTAKKLAVNQVLETLIESLQGDMKRRARYNRLDQFLAQTLGRSRPRAANDSDEVLAETIKVLEGAKLNLT